MVINQSLKTLEYSQRDDIMQTLVDFQTHFLTFFLSTDLHLRCMCDDGTICMNISLIIKLYCHHDI